MKKSVKNINELTEDLSNVYNELRAGKIQIVEAKELANVAGKMVKSSSVKLEYNKYMSVKTPIPFLADANDSKGK